MYKPISVNAIALQPVRILYGELRSYTILTAPPDKDANTWLLAVLNRISICGVGYKYDKDHVMFDLLNKTGDVIDEYILSKNAWEYARKQLKFELIHYPTT